MADVKSDLPPSMAMAAFTGISWYIGAEVGISLCLILKRRRGVYFWSCALASWGVIPQPLFIILVDFGVWTDKIGSITLIYLTCFMIIIPQSWALYSRLHLVVSSRKLLNVVRIALIITSVVFPIPTMVLGILAQTSNTNPDLFAKNVIWDRTQFIVTFVQETSLSVLYIYQTRKYLQRTSLLAVSSPIPTANPPKTEKRKVFYHLIYMNILIVVLDIALLGIQSVGLLYLQGAFKPAVYGIKLKVEFLILNRLIQSVRPRRARDGYVQNKPKGGTGSVGWVKSKSNEEDWPGRHGRQKQAGGNDFQMNDFEVDGGFASQSRESQSPILARTVTDQ